MVELTTPSVTHFLWIFTINNIEKCNTIGKFVYPYKIRLEFY